MKSVRFHASPVLAVKLPAWRSRLVLCVLFLAFVAFLLAAYIQGGGTWRGPHNLRKSLPLKGPRSECRKTVTAVFIPLARSAGWRSRAEKRQ